MKRLSLSLGVLSSCALTLTPLSANAQDGTAPPPTTPAPAPTEATPAQPAATAPATPAQGTAPAAPQEPPDEGHFRWGISGMGGSFFPGPTTIAFGLEGRFGYAFNRTVTAFASAGSVAGIGFGRETSSTGGSLSVSAVSYWYIGANADALLAGPLFVGGGAALGRGGWGVVSQSASSSGGSQEVIVAGGFMPSVNGRLGLHFGKTNEQTGKRSGFVLALDFRVLIAPNSAKTTQSAGAGGASQSVTVDTTAIGFSPMLMLGYDLR